MSAETPPWADVPTCPKCKKSGLLAHVPDEDNVIMDHGMYADEALDAANDNELMGEWLWCTKCEDTIEVGPAAYKQAASADAWWNRDDREQAWEEVKRLRKVDAIAAEHARRQLPLFGGGS